MYRVHLFMLSKLVPEDIWVNDVEEAVKKLKTVFAYAQNVKFTTQPDSIDIKVEYDAANDDGVMIHHKRRFTLMN